MTMLRLLFVNGVLVYAAGVAVVVIANYSTACLPYLIVVYWLPSSNATVGLDISSGICQGMSSSDWSCLHGKGYSFAIIQTWSGGYDFNHDIANCVNDAWAAGFSHVDVYAFLCPNCNDNYPASSAVSTIANDLKSVGLSGGGTGKGRFGMLWFDVEQCSGCWNAASANANFLADGVNEANKLGFHVGIYSSDYEWGATVGGSTAFTNYPLWYADWDGQQSFSDFGGGFGGWKSPSMKQYADSGQCISMDSDWYPSSVEPWWWGNMSRST